MSAHPVRQPDPSVKAPKVKPLPLDLLRRVLGGVQRMDTTEPPPPSTELIVAGPRRHETPRTASDRLRVLALISYPELDGIPTPSDVYARTMRQVSIATGTTGLGEYWQVGRFIAGGAR